MNMKKRIICLLLVIVMVIGMMPAMSLTAAAASGTAVSNFSDLKSKLEAGTSVYLSSNFDITNTIEIPSGKTVTLDLNGHTLTRSSQKATNGAFVVTGSLTVINSSSTSGGITGHGIASSNTTDSGYGSIFYVNGGTLKLNTGNTGDGQIILQNNRHNCGGGVYVNNNGTLNMYDGVTIKNCQAEGGSSANYGGGVYVYNSTFNMYGGTIDGCIAQYGGGVFVHKAVFNMSGGTIKNCTCARGGNERIGGALYLYDENASSGTHKKSTLSGGFIQDNGAAASDCGGIYVHGLDLLITGTVTIKGNSSDSSSHTSTMYVKKYGQVTIEGGYFGKQDSGGTTMTYDGSGEDIKITSGKFYIGSQNKYEYKSGGNRTEIKTGVQDCSITFNKNGGSGGTSSGTAKYGNQLPTITVPTREGYKFLGYYDAFGEEYYGADGTKIKTNCDYVGSMTLTAGWESAPCTVTLNINGGTTAADTTSVQAYLGSAMPTINSFPKRTGYTFAGYFDTSSATGGTKYYNANGTSAKNWDKTNTTATLYAHWTANTYTVTLDKNGGTADGTTSVTATYDANMPVPTGFTLPTRTGYTFEGYFDTNAATGGTKYYNADGTSAKNWDKTDTTATLYARWTANTYTVTLDPNGGVAGTASVTATYDANMPTGVTMPTKPGYTSTGFYKYATDTSGVTNTQYYNGTAGSEHIWDITEDTTLYAHWYPISYSIQYWSQDDRPAAKDDAAFVETVTGVRYGSYMLKTAAELNLTRTHYDFVGWNMYSGQDWAMYQAGKTLSGGLITTPGTAMIYAAWKEKPQFTVSYNANGGTGAPPDDSVYRDDDYTVSSTVPTRDGYTFTGWLMGNNAYSGGNKIANVQGNITLVAKWQRNDSVSYHPNGGSYAVPLPALYPAQGETVNINFTNVPTRDGYIFKGYATYPGATSANYTESGTKSFTMGAAGVTLYAVWGPENYTISFSGCNGRYTFDGTQPTAVNRDADYTFKLKINTAEYNTNNLAVTVNGVAVEYTGAVDSENYKVFTYTVKSAKGTQNIVIKGIASEPQQITYELNGGAIEGEYPAYYENGTGATLPAAVTRTGHTFGGWFDNEGCTGDAVTVIGTAATGDKTFYAKWTANSYTIHYDANGGIGAVADKSTKYDEVVTLPEQGSMAHGGYTFLGWDEDANAVMPTYHAGDSVKNLTAAANGTVTLYAIWDEEHYTVTYHINGGVMQNTFALIQTVKHGTTITTPAQNALKKTGNEFLGWATSEGSAIVAYAASTNVTVNGNMDLYAVWKAGSYTITYYNGETAIGDPQDMTFGTAAALRGSSGLTAPANKEFLGWSRNATATTAEFIGGQKVTAIGDGTKKEINLYAVWGDKTAKYLTYNANGGNWIGSVPESVVDYGDGSVTLESFDSEKLSRPGYTRDGWLIGDKKYADGETIIITKNTNVFANWIPNNYTVKFNANGGGGVTANMEMTYDVEATLSTNGFFLNGYTFKGWARRANGPLIYTDGESVLNLTNLANSEVNLYAVWEAIDPVWVVYNANGGMKAPEVASFAKETTATVTSSTPTLTGYTFVKWNTKADGTGTDYASGATFTIKENMTLYAVWTEATYTVTFDANGGTLAGGTGTTKDVTVTYGKESSAAAAAAADFSRDNYTLTGWSLSKRGDVVVEPGEPLSMAITGGKAVTLYAVWETAPYQAIEVETNCDAKVNFTSGNVKNGFLGLGKSRAQLDKIVTFNVSGINENYTDVTVKVNGSAAVASGTDYKFTVSEKNVITIDAAGYKYTVTYYANGGTGDAVTQNATSTDLPLQLLGTNTNFTRTGYTLTGWAESSKGSVRYELNEDVNEPLTDKVGGTVTLYAVWKADTYTFTFNSDGGSKVKEFTRGYGDTLGTLPEPTKAGHSFNGWFLNDGKQVTAETVVNNELATEGNITEKVVAGGVNAYTIPLTAKWTINTYDVTVHETGNKVGTVTFATPTTLANGTTLVDNSIPKIEKAPYDTRIEFTVTPTPGYQMKDLIVTANGTPLKCEIKDNVGTFSFNLTKDTVLLVYDGGSGVNFTVSTEGYSDVYDGTNHWLKAEIAPDINLLSNITYQWYKDNHLLNGATQQTFKVKNVADSGEYKCVVKAIEKDSGNSKQYTTEPATVKITPKEVTVTAVDRSVVYGNDLPAFAFNYDGFVAGETSAVITGTPTVESESYAAGKPVGTYTDIQVKSKTGENNVTVVDGISADNYTFKPGNAATLTVTQRPLAVKWNRTTFFYDGEEHTVLAVPTNLFGNDEVELRYDEVNGTVSATGIGKYTATITGCTGKDSGNYMIPNGSISHNWSIGRRAEGDEPQETGVTISPETVNMVVGEEKLLTATVEPAGVEQAVFWESSDESVVTVIDGKLTAIGAGTATVTVTTELGDSDTCTVTVTAKAIPASATDLRLSKRTAIITTKDGTVDLNISLIGFDADTMEILAGSSDELVAKAEISHHNRVLRITADDNGTATIKVDLVKDGVAIASDTCDVTVFISDTKVVESVEETFTGYVIHYTDGTTKELSKTRSVEFNLDFDALISPNGLKSTFDELASFFDKLTERRLAAKRAQSESQTQDDSSQVESDSSQIESSGSTESTEAPIVYGGVAGRDGVGIVSIEKTGTKDNLDTYTISYSDGTTSTFIVTNGVDGHTPVITIGDNGNWCIDGVDTGKNAVVKDTTIWGFVGIGIPVAGLIAAAIFMFLKIRKLEELLMGKK